MPDNWAETQLDSIIKRLNRSSSVKVKRFLEAAGPEERRLLEDRLSDVSNVGLRSSSASSIGTASPS